MHLTSVERNIKVPAETAWKVISRLTAVEDYLPAVKTTKLTKLTPPYVRKLVLADGSSFDENIHKLDHCRMSMIYDISDPSPFPYTNYTGSVKILGIDQYSCKISWSCMYKPNAANHEDIDRYLSAVFNSGIEGVENYCIGLQETKSPDEQGIAS